MLCFFFFNDTATTEIYTLSLHDALPISGAAGAVAIDPEPPGWRQALGALHMGHAQHIVLGFDARWRSEEHTSELQSQSNLVCRLLLEKKKKGRSPNTNTTTTLETGQLST